MDSELARRALKSQTAEICRLCLQQRYLVNINANQYLGMQLKECFPHIVLDDKELPQFVCGECYQLVDITYQFSVRMRRTEVLLRTFVHMGGHFPEPAMLEAEYRRTSKRTASPERHDVSEPPVKKRVSWEEYSKTNRKEHKNAKKEDQQLKYTEKERESLKHAYKRQSSSKHEKRDRKSSRRTDKSGTDNKATGKRSDSSRTQERRYYKSDVFLFGEVVELETDGRRNDPVGKTTNDVTTATQPELVTSNLTSMNLKMTYEDMMNALQTIQNIENNKLNSKNGAITYVSV